MDYKNVAHKRVQLTVSPEENITLQATEKLSMSNDYVKLKNKPIIEDGVVEGNKTFEDYGLIPLTNQDIEALIKAMV